MQYRAAVITCSGHALLVGRRPFEECADIATDKYITCTYLLLILYKTTTTKSETKLKLFSLSEGPLFRLPVNHRTLYHIQNPTETNKIWL
jgi:hypothetical protein